MTKWKPKWKVNMFWASCLSVGLLLAVKWPIWSGSVNSPNSPNNPDRLQSTIAPSTAYKWQNVAIGGAGYVTGIAIHPREPDLIYIRTDVGGAYRWNETEEKWLPLMEDFGASDRHLFGIESLALDPNNPNIVYAAAGEYLGYDKPKGSLLKSSDRGRTWRKTNLPFNLGANEKWRWNGERLAIDPNQPNLLYLGSRNDGLWQSSDGGETIEKVANFPARGTENRGISFVVFDPKSGKSGQPTRTIYIGVAGAGVYRSEDSGKTWQLLPGTEKNPNRAALAADGTLYVTFDRPGGIKKFRDNAWTDVTPVGETDFNAISVDANNPERLVAAEYFLGAFNRIFRSEDGGQTWQEEATNKSSVVPWAPDWYWGIGIAALAIDPHRNNRVWYVDGTAAWRTDDINENPSKWRNYVAGHEEIVNFSLKSQPGSGALLQGSADIAGLRHRDLTSYPRSQMLPQGVWVFDLVSIDSSEANPNFVASVGGRRNANNDYPDPGYGGYSTDDGKTWKEFASYPQGFRKSQNGRIAVSATSDRHIVWAPEKDVPYYSKDRGQTWQRSQGAPADTTVVLWQWNQPLAADKINGNKFYLYKAGQFYRSTDGGDRWEATASNLPNLDMDWDNGAWSNIKAAPGIEGEVWASFHKNGLYRSRDSGSSFTKLEKVRRADNFAFGKNPPGRSHPTVFLYGIANDVEGNDVEGVFRSDDMGETWVKIDVPGARIGKGAFFMEGDRLVYGRVYIGTGGRGIYYGEP